MPIARPVRSPACAVAALLLGGCIGPSLSADAPAGVSLAGSWKLDHAASDDPERILAKMRAEANRLLARRSPGEQDDGSGNAHARRGDPLRRSPMAHVIRESAARGDFLTVRQSADELVLDYGGSQRSFTPGQHSVVSAEGGVGDQVSGWKGRDYVIEVHAQQGPSVTERYSLSADGAHLVERLRIGAAELPAVELKRVYDRSVVSAVPEPPISD